MKNAVFMIAVVATFAMGLYSLFLASANAGKERSTNATGFMRTAAPADTGKITLASGSFIEQELVFVILYPTDTRPNPGVDKAVQRAVRILSDAGTAAAIRLLGPHDPDYTAVIEQNGVDRFPSVLAVIKERGIVLVSDEINEKILLNAYHSMRGRTSSCEDAKSTIY